MDEVKLLKLVLSIEGVRQELRKIHLMLHCWVVGEALDALPPGTDTTVLRAAMLSLLHTIEQ